LLHDTLNQSFDRPFAFLDIACGDASQMRALSGTKVRHYHGVDLSEPALELAANNLKDMPFEVELDHGDFVEAVTRRPGPADVAWCSLSIHHLVTDEKLRLMRALHGSTGSFLMIYEPTRQDGETREGYLQRFRRVNRPRWTMLTPEEWAQIDHADRSPCHHLRSAGDESDVARSRAAGWVLEGPRAVSGSDRLLSRVPLRPVRHRPALHEKTPAELTRPGLATSSGELEN